MLLRQGCHRVLVSLFSWPGQLLSLNPCQRPKILARMLFWGILSLTVVILEITAYLIRDCDYWGKQTAKTCQAEVLVDESDLFHFLYEHYPQCTYVTEWTQVELYAPINLGFSNDFTSWFESVSYLSLSGPNILFLTQTPLLCLFYLNTLSWSWCAFCGIQVIFPHIFALSLSNFVATDVYALSLKFWKSLPAVFFPYLA